MAHLLSLMPLRADAHRNELTRLYRAVPAYRAQQGLSGNPYLLAEQDLRAAEAAADRALLGILRAVDAQNPAAGAELVGIVDFRRHWPQEGVATLGALLVAEQWQRQGIGRQAWGLLEPWLADQADISRVVAGVEQFNPGGLRFLQALGFTLTGEAERVRLGDRLVRRIMMEKAI
ncbi:MAG: GNAT family N-acetyltransferase [Caldilineaceae bacterium]|nr:GNAT family N-acetyltransferase [Caldilineaceae bacterium]MCB9139821.1 GNAT family N-acetyltransferase [Caldilineaceae bacterium]